MTKPSYAEIVCVLPELTVAELSAIRDVIDHLWSPIDLNREIKKPEIIRARRQCFYLALEQLQIEAINQLGPK